MKKISIRIPQDYLETIDLIASTYDIDRSEVIRRMIYGYQLLLTQPLYKLVKPLVDERQKNK